MKPRSSQKYRWDGETMQKRRKDVKLTQQDIADALGTSKSYVCEIEKGSQPSAGYAFYIAKLLKKPVNFFIKKV